MNNAQIAYHLQKEIMELSKDENNFFRTKSLQKAVETINRIPFDLAGKSPQELTQINGIGKGIADRIVKIVQENKTGGGADLLQIEGLGIKTLQKIEELFGEMDLAKVKQLAEAGSLLQIPRMSPKTVVKILEGIGKIERGENIRRPAATGQSIADRVLKDLDGLVERVEAVGSLRRGSPTIKDVDIIIVTNNRKAVYEKLVAESYDLVMSGEAILRFRDESGVMTDITFLDPQDWAPTLLYRTGDKNFNIFMRAIAKSKGWRLNEHGLFGADGALLARDSEEQIFKAYGWPFIPPQDRADGRWRKYTG